MPLTRGPQHSPRFDAAVVLRALSSRTVRLVITGVLMCGAWSMTESAVEGVSSTGTYITAGCLVWLALEAIGMAIGGLAGWLRGQRLRR